MDTTKKITPYLSTSICLAEIPIQWEVLDFTETPDSQEWRGRREGGEKREGEMKEGREEVGREGGKGGEEVG